MKKQGESRSSVFRRSFRKEFPVAVRGEGVYVWDSAGNKYLDLAGSAAVNLIGHGVPEISAAMTEQAGKLEFVHTSQFTTPIAEEYAEELLAFAGKHFEGGAVYFTCGGSESVETALKLARQYQVEIGQSQRHQILSRHQSYHGSTLGALSVSGNKRRREMYLPMVREFPHIGMPYCYRCAFDCTDGCRNCGQQYASELEGAIEGAQGEVAAFIFEPVSGATLGAVTPPPGFERLTAWINNQPASIRTPGSWIPTNPAPRCAGAIASVTTSAWKRKKRSCPVFFVISGSAPSSESSQSRDPGS